jgi:hypothetical protein
MEYTCTHCLFFTGKVNMKKLIMALGLCVVVAPVEAADGEKELVGATAALTMAKKGDHQRRRSQDFTPDGSPISGGFARKNWGILGRGRGLRGAGLTRQKTDRGVAKPLSPSAIVIPGGGDGRGGPRGLTRQHTNHGASASIDIPGGGRGRAGGLTRKDYSPARRDRLSSGYDSWEKGKIGSIEDEHCPDGVPLGVSVKTGECLKRRSLGRLVSTADDSGEESDPQEVVQVRPQSAKGKKGEERPRSLITFNDGSESD